MTSLIQRKRQDLEQFRGDHGTWRFECEYADGSGPVDIANSAIWFTVKAKRSYDDIQAIFQKKNAAAGGDDNQIGITDAPNGIGKVYLIPTDTDPHKVGQYHYDLQVKLPGGRVETVAYGKFEIHTDITRAS